MAPGLLEKAAFKAAFAGKTGTRRSRFAYKAASRLRQLAAILESSSAPTGANEERNVQRTRHLIAAALIASLGLGLSLSASAHGGEYRGEGRGRGEWQERHYRHHHHGWERGGPSYYRPAPVYAAPPVVYERPVIYSQPPVYAYPRQPSVVIGFPPLVIPLR
jgi:hypothetical protein